MWTYDCGFLLFTGNVRYSFPDWSDEQFYEGSHHTCFFDVLLRLFAPRLEQISRPFLSDWMKSEDYLFSWTRWSRDTKKLQEGISICFRQFSQLAVPWSTEVRVSTATEFLPEETAAFCFFEPVVRWAGPIFVNPQENPQKYSVIGKFHN